MDERGVARGRCEARARDVRVGLERLLTVDFLNEIADKARAAPDGPGVYAMLGGDQELLYVGKAANLRRRLADYGRGEQMSHPRLRRLLGAVRDVRWIACADEREALCREADVIVGLRPRFNAAMRGDAPTYICVVDRSRFTMTEHAEASAYGAFAHLGKGRASWRGVRTNAGYSAFLRLLWATQDDRRKRSRIPSRLRGSSPPVVQDIDITPDRWPAVHRFLSGRRDRLLRDITLDVPQFMRRPLERDLVAAREFFDLGPRAIDSLRRRHALPTGPIDPETFARLVATELTEAIGPFRLPERKRHEPADDRRRSRHT